MSSHPENDNHRALLSSGAEAPDESEEALWRRVLEARLAQGARTAEAVEDANLIVDGLRKRRTAAR